MIDRAPHFLLDVQAGWRATALVQASVASGCLRLEPLPGALRPLGDGQGTLGGLQNAQGIAVDCEDRIYVLDSAGCVVRRFDRCSGVFELLPCLGPQGSAPRRLDNPQGLAISQADDLYIADSGNRRVQIFALRGLALRRILGPLVVQNGPAGVTVRQTAPVSSAAPSGDCAPQVSFPAGTWAPWDVAVNEKRGLYVADYANGYVHAFDPEGRWRAAYNGQSPSTSALVKPTRLAVDRQGRIYVLQEGQSHVVILDPTGKFSGTISQPAEVSGQFCPTSIAVDLNRNLCLGDCFTQRVFFYRPDRAGGWCTYRCCGSADCSAQTMMFDRLGKSLLAAGGPGLCQMLPDGAFPRSGTYLAGPLDSKTYQCVWDRVQMTAHVPPGAAIRVDTFTSEGLKDTAEVAGLDPSRWSTGQLHSTTNSPDWDCLIQAPPARYLWLRLTLEGDGSAGPEIERVKVYYPRSSSLQYLPAVYRSEPTTDDFLDRFLSIFDTLRRGSDDTVTGIASYFDPHATPANPPGAGGADFLSWLAGWMGMTLKSGWPIATRRRLLANAHRLYKLRGTPEGLRLHIQLYSGVEPRILELFRLRRWLSVGDSRLGDDTTVAGESPMNRLQVGVNSNVGSFQLFDFGDPKLDIFTKYAYRFLVVVPRWAGAGDAEQRALEEIIEAAKPAHTLAQFQWAEPRLRIGLQALVGVDTVIVSYSSGVIEGQGKLGYDTVLGDPRDSGPGPSLRVARNSVIGMNSKLM